MSKNIINIKTNIVSPKVIIVKSFSDIDEIVIELKSHQPLIINTGNLKSRDAFRVIDFISGFCYGLNGKSQKIDDYIYRFEIK